MQKNIEFSTSIPAKAKVTPGNQAASLSDQIAITLPPPSPSSPSNHGDSCHNSGKIIHNRRKFPPIILGMLLALAFCPESAIMYFSLFTLETSMLSPFIFSIGAAIPIIVMGYAIEKSANKFDELQNKFKKLQRWINILVGSVFIIFAVYLLINH